MTPKTSTQRAADRKERLRSEGLKEVRNLWAHPADIPALKAHAAELQSARTEAAAKLTAKRTQPTTRRKKP